MGSKGGGTERFGKYSRIAAGLLLAVGGASMADAQSTTTTAAPQLGSAHIVEWDLPIPIDFNPGAVVVDTRGEDNNRAWFVTRLSASAAGERKVYRFDFGPSLMKNNGNARWTSWDLAPDVVNNGGVAKLRASHDRRFAVVRTSSSIQEVDTLACPAGTIDNPTVCAAGLRRWDVDDPESPADSPFVSDIAVDDGRRIFSAGRSQAFMTGYVQMLVPTKVPFTANTDPIIVPKGSGVVIRWRVDGVDACQSGVSGFCNSGIDFQPSSSNQNLIYVSDQGNNAIAELNVSTSQIRRWALPPDANGHPVLEPRQLKIDSNGIVWVNTASGHLVSLNPKNSSGCPSGMNKMTRHEMPEMATNDPWGVAPDSNVVGYTDSQTNKVGMLLPRDAGVCVGPSSETTTTLDIGATVTTIPTTIVSDVTPGIPKMVLKKTTPKPDGTFVEAVLNMPAPNADPTMAPPDSMQPLGITPVKWKGQGTFFYAVGATGAAGTDPLAASFAKRVGFIRLGIPERINNPRDDDDADDGLDTTTHPTWHVAAAGDFDADGVPDQYDTATGRENLTTYNAAPLPAMNTTDYAVSTTATSLALIASAQADNATATIAVDIYNSVGTLVGTSGPLVGVAAATLPSPGAGNFTVRVRNLSGSAVNHTPTIVVREPLVP